MLVREASTDFQMVQYLLDFYRDVYADFTELETLIQSDGASSKFTRRDYFKDHVEDVPADVAAEYSAYMASTMRAIAAVALDDLDVRAVRRAVDLCGGPGTFAIELAARHGARVAFVDVPPVVAFSRQVLATAGAVAELVEPVAGDAFAYEIGSDVDLVTMCRAAHDWSDEQCQRLFDRLGQQLRPGARFAIIERLLPDELAAEAQNLYVRSLYFLSKSTTAQYRTPRRYRAMLAQAASPRSPSSAPAGRRIPSSRGWP
jgi:SAM-dependent methyltransferase